MFELVKKKKPHLNGDVNINKRELNGVIAHVQGIAHFYLKAELQMIKPYIPTFRWLNTEVQVIIVTAGSTGLRASLITPSAGREGLDLEETVQC